LSNAVKTEMGLEDILKRCQDAIEGTAPQEVQRWKEKTGGKAVGYFPVYSPMELIYANGILPVGILGGGTNLDIERADAYFGSFVCSIVKTTTEMGLRGDMKYLDGMIFHSICDAARNLGSVYKGNFSSQFVVDYIHYPQNPSSPAAVDYLVGELNRIQKSLEKINGKPLKEDSLRQSFRAYNENRRLIRNLYRIKKETPHLLSIAEAYQLVRAGYYLPPEEHSEMLRIALEEIPQRKRKERDTVRVVLEGSFCEQPPVDFLKILDESGCAVVDDDLLIGRRYYEEDIPLDGDPIRALADSYLNRSSYTSVTHDWRKPRSERLIERVRNSGATAVVFGIAKFCEPALLDYPVFKRALEQAGIPHIVLEFEEKMWTFESLKNDLATFVESILFD